MKRIRPYLLCLVLFVILSSCNDCDDCLDTQQKNVLVLDNDGNNLLFGDNAVFNPLDVNLTLENGAAAFWFVDEETRSISFSLEPDQTTYILQLDENNTATLVFELGERKSERCCGNQIYSTSSQVNGVAVDNSDTITIVN